MPRGQTWRSERFRFGRIGCRGIEFYGADHSLDLLTSNTAGTKQQGRGTKRIEHSRLNAYFRRSGIEHSIDAPLQFAKDVVCSGRANSSEPVCARSRERKIGRCQEGACDWMCRYADRNCLSSGRYGRRKLCRFRKKQRKRARPEAPSEILCHLGKVCCHSWHHLKAPKMDNQRIPCRTSFGFEDALHGCWIERIGGEPVYGLGWN